MTFLLSYETYLQYPYLFWSTKDKDQGHYHLLYKMHNAGVFVSLWLTALVKSVFIKNYNSLIGNFGGWTKCFFKWYPKTKVLKKKKKKVRNKYQHKPLIHSTSSVLSVKYNIQQLFYMQYFPASHTYMIKLLCIVELLHVLVVRQCYKICFKNILY